MDLELFEKYKKLLIENGHSEADEYKNSLVPNILYKYFPCNENRINSLHNKKLWLAQHTTFKDPNEFKFMFIDENQFINSEIIGEKWSILIHFLEESFFDIKFKDAIRYLEEIKKIVSISCFTTDPNNDYFWDEYAEKRNGFCIEYEIGRKDIFYPIIYTNDKVEISSIVKTIIVEMKKTMKDEEDFEKEHGYKANIVSDDGLELISYLYFNYCCKHLEFEPENEYRIVFANTEVQTASGKLVDYSDLGIKASKIFIGSMCSDDAKMKLVNIANNLNIKYIFE